VDRQEALVKLGIIATQLADGADSDAAYLFDQEGFAVLSARTPSEPPLAPRTSGTFRRPVRSSAPAPRPRLSRNRAG
jgi:hypothetical protein